MVQLKAPISDRGRGGTKPEGLAGEGSAALQPCEGAYLFNGGRR